MVFYTVYGYPSMRAWWEVMEILRTKRVPLFETSIALSLPSPELGDEVRSALLALRAQDVSPREIGQAYAHLRPSLFIIHSASLLSETALAGLLRDLKGRADAVLLSEGSPVQHKMAREWGFDVAVEVSPRTKGTLSDATLRYASAFVYLQAATRTGGDPLALEEIARTMETIRAYTNVPVLCGFGVRTPEQVKRFATLEGCSGVIVGSELLRRLRSDEASTFRLHEVEDYVDSMLEASRR